MYKKIMILYYFVLIYGDIERSIWVYNVMYVFLFILNFIFLNEILLVFIWFFCFKIF